MFLKWHSSSGTCKLVYQAFHRKLYLQPLQSKIFCRVSFIFRTNRSKMWPNAMIEFRKIYPSKYILDFIIGSCFFSGRLAMWMLDWKQFLEHIHQNEVIQNASKVFYCCYVFNWPASHQGEAIGFKRLPQWRIWIVLCLKMQNYMTGRFTIHFSAGCISAGISTGPYLRETKMNYLLGNAF